MRTTFISVSVFVFLTGSLTAQKLQDPLLGDYILGNSAEMFMVWDGYSDDNYLLNQQIFDFDKTTYSFQTGTKHSYTGNKGLGGDRNLDVATGDFNGDGTDDVVIAWEGPDRSLNVMIPEISKENLDWDQEHFISDKGIIKSAFDFQGQIRIAVGNFDNDPSQEFVVAYLKGEMLDYDCTINISLFEADTDLKISLLDSVAAMNLEYIRNALGEITFHGLWDITAGDFDNDGLDEVFLLQQEGNTWPNIIGSNAICEIRFYLGIYDIDQNQKLIKQDHEGTHGTAIPQIVGELAKDMPMSTRLSIASGNIDSDGADEIVVLFETLFRVKLYSYCKKYLVVCKMKDCDLTKPQFLSPGHAKLLLNQVNHPIDVDRYIYFYRGSATSLACGDLNTDGIDEIVTLGGKYLTILNYNPATYEFKKIIEKPIYDLMYGIEGRRMLAISDLNADTTESTWIPEIVLIDSLGNYNNYNKQGRVCIYQPVLGTNKEINDARLEKVYITTIGSPKECAIALGDFDGDGIRLGSPTYLFKDEVFNPLIVLNAPPLHFDVFNGTIYDVCKAFGDNKNDFDNFMLTYTQSSDEAKTSSSEYHSDWAASTKLSVSTGFKIFGMGSKFEASIEGRWGGGTSKTEVTSEKVSVKESTTSIWDDQIYGLVTDFDVWEYPVYCQGARIGDLMFTLPYKHEDTEWRNCSDLVLEVRNDIYKPNHELGNILSYNGNLSEDTTSIVHKGLIKSVGVNPWGDWSVTHSHFTEKGRTDRSNVGMSVSASLEVSGFIGSAKWETNGSYDRNEVTNFSTMINEEFNIELILGDADINLGSVSYKVQPYIYWSSTGLLVVDYLVNPIVTSNANDLASWTWWDNNYRKNTDPAFILPMRYHPEKGFKLEPESLRFRTKDIAFSPSNPVIGDTVTIYTWIHNYSLLPFEGSLSVHYFIDDPDSNGTPIQGISGESNTNYYITIPPRGKKLRSFDWVITDYTPHNPVIYAVIDYNNEITEIHENNNKGARFLPFSGGTGVIDDLATNTPFDYSLFQNYPNPFNPSTTIRFVLPRRETIKIEVFDILGRSVDILMDKSMPAGSHNIEFIANNLSSGVYFYRIEAGSFQQVKKMLVMK